MNRAAIIFNILTLVAVFTGPIIALRLQRYLDERRDAKQRKLWIFRAIMSNRASILNSNYVQALNLIDIDFASKSKEDKAVRTAWKVLLDHLSTKPAPNETSVTASSERAVDLRVALMKALAIALGYDFDEVQIKKGSYLPTGHTDLENEQNLLRKRLLEVLGGQRRIPVGVFRDEFPPIDIKPAND